MNEPRYRQASEKELATLQRQHRALRDTNLSLVTSFSMALSEVLGFVLLREITGNPSVLARISKVAKESSY